MSVEELIIQEEDKDTDTSGLTVRGEDNNNQKEARKKGERSKIGRKIRSLARADRSSHNEDYMSIPLPTLKSWQIWNPREHPTQGKKQDRYHHHRETTRKHNQI